MNVTNIYLHTSNRTNRQITVYFKGYALLHNDGIGVSPTPSIRSKLDTIQLPFKGISRITIALMKQLGNPIYNICATNGSVNSVEAVLL